jgi:ATP-dependent exoDNAse (exonuclease V) alpha subunit
MSVGARVIFTKNDGQKRWVNGSLGTISRITDGQVAVRLDSGNQVLVEKENWEVRELVEYPPTKPVGKPQVWTAITGWVVQYPLRLGWAITVHKSQGVTLEEAALNFEDQYFESGQAYVALSRVKTMSGLYFMSDISSEHIFQPHIDATVFMNRAEKYPYQDFHTKNAVKSARMQQLEEILVSLGTTAEDFNLALESFCSKNHSKTIEQRYANIFEKLEAGRISSVSSMIEFIVENA